MTASNERLAPYKCPYCRKYYSWNVHDFMGHMQECPAVVTEDTRKYENTDSDGHYPPQSWHTNPEGFYPVEDAITRYWEAFYNKFGSPEEDILRDQEKQQKYEGTVVCQECGAEFWEYEDLETHGQMTGHNIYNITVDDWPLEYSIPRPNKFSDNDIRQDKEGNQESSYNLIAQYWSVYLGTMLSELDVANMLELFKMARWQVTDKEDHMLDKASYAEQARKFTE